MEPRRNELVRCQLYWQLAQQAGGCQSYSYLQRAEHNPFGDGEGEVCVVEQITAAEAARGELGWYYVDSAPRDCENLGPGAVFPRQHPEQFRVLMRCSIAKSHDADEVVDIAPNSCSAPPSAATDSDVGKLCSREVYLSERAPSLRLGEGECATGACLTTPFGTLKCAESGGVQYCGSSTTRCTCRCAGEDEQDPGPFCACPEDHECTPTLTSQSADQTTRGSYCTPKEKLPIPGN